MYVNYRTTNGTDGEFLPATLLSLWELMENFKPLADRIRRLTEMVGRCDAIDQLKRTTEVPLSYQDKAADRAEKALDAALSGLEEDLRIFELDAASDRLMLLRQYRTEHPGFFGLFLRPYIETLIEAMIGQLARRYYVFMPSDVANLYKEPLGQFARSLFRFPSIKNDVEEACRCYALERYTASVFHSMGILQIGLYSLAAEVKVSFPFNIELADWQAVIAQIESKIRAMQNLPKSDEKDDKLSFFSELAVQFRYFKDAWRNHVAHLREEYDKDQAHSILVHVRDFMELASTKLRELPRR